jgi:hypothetical protein
MVQKKSRLGLAVLAGTLTLLAAPLDSASAAPAAGFRPKPCLMSRARLQPHRQGICPGTVRTGTWLWRWSSPSTTVLWMQ